MRADKTDQSFNAIVHLAAAVINSRVISTGLRTNRIAGPNGKLSALISTRCASPISNSMELLSAPALSFHNAHSKAATAAKSQSILAIANFEICIVRYLLDRNSVV